MSVTQDTDGVELPDIDSDAFEGMYDGLTEATDSDVAEAVPEEPFPNDESRFEKTYVAIDGIDVDELSDEQIDAIEKEVANAVLLNLNLPATGVRVISGDNYVVEHSTE